MVEVSLAGEPDPVTGMVLDLKELKEILNREVVEPYDHRFLNYEVPPFDRVVPTTENIARDIWRRLEPRLHDGAQRLHAVRVYETPDLYVDYFGEPAVFRVTRRYRFSASHRLHSRELSESENRELYGKCNNPLRPRPQLRGGSERARAGGRSDRPGGGYRRAGRIGAARGDARRSTIAI